MARWVEAGYPPDQARELVAGDVASARHSAGPATGQTPFGGSTVLFAGTAEACRTLPPGDYAAAADLLRAFAARGDKWAAFAQVVDQAPEPQRGELLAGAGPWHASSCGRRRDPRRLDAHCHAG